MISSNLSANKKQVHLMSGLTAHCVTSWTQMNPTKCLECLEYITSLLIFTVVILENNYKTKTFVSVQRAVVPHCKKTTINSNCYGYKETIFDNTGT